MTSLKDKLFTITLTAICIITVTACGNETGKPASSNRPYEVLLIGDSENIVYNELTDTVVGLPQPEPSFDVIQTKDSTKTPWQQLTRNIVRVVLNKEAKQVLTAYKRDVHAKPQIVLTITTPSFKELSKYIGAHPGYIRRLLNTFELSCQLGTLKAHNNPKARQTIKRIFGIDMLIPLDMQSSKKGKDFLWLSNNSNSGLESICLYRIKASSSSINNGTDKKLTTKEKSFCHIRDSVMRINIPGEHDGMYMETTDAYRGNTHSYNPTGAMASLIGSYCGLWDMHNDAMGGPFIAVELYHPPYIIYIEGFVYAPESKKRNKIRRLEACLYSAIKSERTKHKE